MLNRLRILREWGLVLLSIFLDRKQSRINPHRLNYLLKIFERTQNISLTDQQSAERFIMNISTLIELKAENDSVRYGSINDGGYVLKKVVPGGILISEGLAQNIEFELEMIDHGFSVYAFDPTISQIGTERNFKHINRALEGHPSDFSDSINLDMAIEGAFETYGSNRNMVLKLDIEGSEWSLIDEFRGDLAVFSQIVIEFHDFSLSGQEAFRRRATDVFHRLTEKFEVIAINSNNFSELISFGSAFVADVVEMSFVRKDLFVEAQNLRVELIHKNDADKLGFPPTPFIIKHTKHI